MIDNRVLDFSVDTSPFDTYFLYGIIGLLLFTAAIGLIVLLITSCCWCFYSISFCFCCYQRQRNLSYRINKRLETQEEKRKPSFLKRQTSNVTNFAQLYDSCPHLINNKAMRNTGINDRNLDSSCTTINTLVNPTTPCGSIRSVRESALPIRNPHRPFSYIKKLNDRVQISRQMKSNDQINFPPAVTVDITQSSQSINGPQTHSPSINIYESLVSTPNINSSSRRTVPIYEPEWTHNLRKLVIKKMPSMENNGISIIELPTPSSSPPDLVPSVHYFQLKQHPYDQVLANRKKTSDSMRRANMLKRIKDDAAFLY